MPHTALCTLPTEIWLRICKSLDHIDARSVWAFAQTNKYLYSIASSRLLHAISFNITTPQALVRDTLQCETLLHRRGGDGFRHVRRVIVVGHFNKDYMLDERYYDTYSDSDSDSDLEGASEGEEGGWHLHRPPVMDWETNRAKLHNLLPVSRSCAVTVSDNSPLGIRSDDTPARAAYDMDPVWRPLANLLSRLPGLTDVIYHCPSQIPPCILHVLHSKRPRPRLQLHGFKMRSLLLEVPARLSSDIELDPHELAIMTSPCLSSLYLEYSDPSECNRLGPWSLQKSALDAMLKLNLAPSLREVRLNYVPFGFRRQQPQWAAAHEIQSKNLQRILQAAHTSTHHPTPLELLELDGRPDNSWLQDWKSPGLYYVGANSSSLRSLKLAKGVSGKVLDELIATPLPLLSSLTFTLSRVTRPRQTIGEYHFGVKKFIRGLPQLVSLHLIGWDHTAMPLESAAKRPEQLGEDDLATLPRGLTTFLLEPESEYRQGSSLIYEQDIRQVAHRCPRIQDLSLVVRRSRGDAAEVAIYHAIACFRQLLRLSLTLDASPPPLVRVDDRMDFLQSCTPRSCDMLPYRNGHILEIMVNNALDRKLACSIFQVISSAQGSSSGSGGTLERLLVRTTGGMNFLPFPGMSMVGRGSEPRGKLLLPYLNGLARSWSVTGYCNKRWVVEAIEIGRGANNWRDDERVLRDPLFVRDGDPFMPYFRMLWPVKGGPESRGWFDDWESWPLTVHP
ncbi:hypothetical protein QBC37DRAFT_317783 [Rhypophila decipiens]|uniref:F-box domain-containing protein n=1 Tax=Rhypophila decipiens TaxID=261697 RepID=A0AAN6Y675_9PEZI|nr:hypothetical protein QBC37DRAFT_317783 [Rhypophila decipiens]